MWRLTIIASVTVLAFAKPEVYKESEDFQYSRSSSDDGTKSGFYGAQRGNMGGNYERAHNMDGLAQHQMSTAVRQVEGELGEGAKTRTGSVYTAANSRGIFGSGNYDLSNLKGRNFEESGAFGDSLSHSSLTSQNTGYRGQSYSAAQNAGYSSGFTKNSRQNSGYHSADYLDQYARNENSHAQDLYQANGQYSYGGHEASGRDYKSYSHGGSQAHKYDYGKSNLDYVNQNVYDSNLYSERVTDTPVSVVMRPGSIVTIPIRAKAQDVSSYKDASYNQNSINTEDVVVDGKNQQIYVKSAIRPKHYESAYSYRKEWEKHNTVPVIVTPTENPFLKNSELYDDSHLLQNAKSQYSTLDTSNAHSSSANVAHSNSYNANTKSASLSKSRYHSESQTQSSSDSNAAHSNAYTLGTHNSQQAADTNHFVEDISSKPKSYHSSYSYHKSWERRGDPYVIKLIGGGISGQTAQRLVAASGNQGAISSHQYGTQYDQAHQSYSQDGIDCDCDENGHIRVARSPDPKAYYNDQQQQQQFEGFQDMGQQVQNTWENLEDLGQQTQKFGQLTQNKWDHSEDLGQQTQNQWDRLEDLGQQTQNQWDTLQELDQQTQNKWDNLEYLGQQTEDQSNIQQNVRQEVQNKKNSLESFDQQVPSELTQQTQDDKFEHFHEQTANEDSIVPIPTLNQYASGDKTKQNNEDPKFWDSINNFDTQQLSQSLDRKETFLNKEDEQVDQQNQFWNMFQENDLGKPVSEQAFPYHLNVNAENENTDKTNDKGIPSLQNHYHNTRAFGNIDVGNNNNPLPLQNLWNKLDKIGSSYTNEDKFNQQKHAFSDTQSTYQSWDKFDLQHSQSAYDDSIFDFIPTSKIQDTTTETPKHEQSTTTSRTNPQKPIQDIYTLGTIRKPTYDTQHRIVPQGPIDVGRGDIGADETLLDSTEKQQINNVPIYIPNKPKNSFKTSEEIESLSLTSENQQTNDDHNSQIENNQRETNEKERESLEKYNRHEDNNYVNNLQEATSHTTNKFNKFSSTTQKSFENLHNNNINYIKEKPFYNRQEPISDNKQHISSGHQLEVAPIDIEQQNMDQQFEDLSQSLQGPLELGQQQQSSWQSSDNFAQRDVQQLENFGKFNNNDNKHNQEEILEQQLEQFGENNQLQSQNMLDIENTWRPSEYPKEGRIQHIQPIQEHAVSEELPISKHFEPQEMQKSFDTLQNSNINNKDIEQQNMDKQFEDFSQSLQGPLDLGQQQQSSRHLSDNFEQSDVQQLENFGKYSNDNQHNQEEILDQQLEQFGDNNQLQSQNMLDIERSWPPSEYPKEGRIQHTQSSQDHALLEELQISKKVEPQKAVQQKDDAIATPVEVTTEKSGFWKSVGNKFTNAKDTVVSWFKS